MVASGDNRGNHSILSEVICETKCAPNGIEPTIMDEPLVDHIATSAGQHAPGRWRRMPSAAGHDPMVISHHLPCAMLFIPSINGISHDFSEDSHEDDIVLGCQVLADAVVATLTASTPDAPGG